MKKIQLFLLLLVGVVSLSSAQNGCYPRLPYLYYQWWYENYFADTNNFQSPWPIGGGDPAVYNSCDVSFSPVPDRYGITELAMRFVIDSSMRILGVSVPLASNTSYYNESIWRLFESEEYVRLYQCRNDSLILIDEMRQKTDHMLEPDEFSTIPTDFRYQHSLTSYDDTCRIEHTAGVDCPSVEYYFDTPKMVFDTFFLSVTFNCLLESVYQETEDDPCLMPIPTITYYGLGDGYGIHPCIPRLWQYPSFAYKTKMRNLYTGDYVTEWRDTMWNVFMCLFPIISYESPLLKCDTATKLQLVRQYENMYTFSWDVSGSQPTSWQFCYAPVGVDPEQGTIIDCSTTTVTITADPSREYNAWVRSYCETFDRYSSWGQALAFGATGGNNPDNISLVDTYTMISPNPASEQLMLQSSFEMQRVEIYAMDGRKAFEAPLSGRNSIVNIDQLLPGTYLVKIFTQAGSTTKKLVVR